MSVFELFGRIAVDSSGAEKGLNDTVKHAKGAEGKLAATFKKIGGLVAAAFSVRAIVDFGKQCTEAYASIAAEESAFAQIMGDYADTAQAKLNAVSDATGVSATRMTGAMTSLTAKFKGLGYNVADATTLATDGLLIATDAAAFWDMSLDESMSHLNSFINGSYEGGEAIGLFANDTQMAAFAVQQGIVSSTKKWAKLDEATKQATRLLYAKQMMEQSGATGQAAKEADAYANVMANLKESWRQFQGVVGKPILEKLVLPAMQKLSNFLPKLTEGVQNGIVFLEEGFGKIKEYFTDVFTEDGINIDALPSALTKMFRDLGSSAGKLLRSFGQKLKTGWTNTVWPAIQGVAAKIGIELPGWTEIETKVKTWWEGGGLAASIASVCNWTLNLFGAPANVTAEDVSGVLSTWWTNTKAFVQKACNWVLGLFGAPADVTQKDVTDTLSTWWTKTKAFAQKACGWVLGLFGAPADVTQKDVTDTLSTWWTKTKAFAQKACNWALGLFGAPADVTQKDVTDKLSTWWTNAKTFVQKACDWTLGLFSPPEDGEGENSAVSTIKTWWEGIKPQIEQYLSVEYWVKNPEVQAVIQQIVTWWNTNVAPELSNAFEVTFGVKPEDSTGYEVGKKLREMWDAAVEWACGKGKNLLTVLFGIEPADTEGSETGEAIKKWWSGVETYIGNIFKGFFHIEPGSTEESTADALFAFWKLATALVTLPVSPTLSFPLLKDAAKAIKDWWDSVVKTITLNLPFGLGKLFGYDEDGENGKDGKDSGVGENGQGGDGKSFGDPKGGKWTPAALGLYDPNWSFGGTNGANTLPGMLATINSTLSTLPAQVEAAAASGVATGVGNITVTGHVTTGNVMLDGSALVGRLAPRINLALGGSGMLRYNMRNPNP